METQSIASIATREKLLDRKFVFAALIIGMAYAVIVVVLGTLAGKEAAGVAGVALTAVATGIFKQFETLRFRTLAETDGTTIYIRKFNWWYFVLLLFANMGIQVVFGFLFGSILAMFGYSMQADFSASFVAMFSDPKSFAGLVILVLAGNFFGGLICGKTAPAIQYSYALLACFAALLLPLVLMVATAAVRNVSALRLLIQPTLYTAGIFWLLYLVGAFFGAWIGFRKRALLAKGTS